MLSSRDLHVILVFAAVVRHGSFTAAAKELRLTKSVVSGHVRTLEERLGARLLERTTRKMRLTQLGEHVFASAERIVQASDEIGAAADAERSAPAGTLRVGATTDLGARFVAPCVARLCQRYDGLDCETLFDDHESDMIEVGLDVSLRLGVPKDSRLVARKLVDDEEVILASPALAATWRDATRPEHLTAAPWLAHAAVPMIRQTFHGPREATAELTVRHHRARASTSATLRALAQQGLGFVVLPLLLADDELVEGSLVRVLDGWRRRKVGLYVVTPSRAYAPSRVTAFVDCVSDAIRTWQSRPRAATPQPVPRARRRATTPTR